MVKKLKGFVALTALLSMSMMTIVGQRQTDSTVNETTTVRRYQQLITAASLASRLYFLASDFFEGRETATRGQLLAAHYLASQYRQLGLTPRGTEATNDPFSPSPYFQPFTLYRRTPKQSRLDVTVDGNRIASSTFSPAVHDDLSFFSTGDFNAQSGNVVFVGYGIADDKLGYDDYAALNAKGLSVNDKWILMLEDEPLADSHSSRLPTPDHKPSRWSGQFINKKSVLWKIGKPRGVLVVSDVSPLATTDFADRANQASLNAKRMGALSLAKDTDFPPTFFISSKLANQLLTPAGHTVAEIKQQIDSTLKPVAFELGDRVVVSAQIDTDDGMRTENVLAYIEGSDPELKDEVVIISAHYDHLGINPNLKGDQIFNGAADDGSGVVACLEMAQWFMKAKRDGVGPRRSILFINFSGEEKGLLGSNHYTSAPVIPWERTVADINMDGVGGIDAKHPTHSRNYLYVVGKDELSNELIALTKAQNASLGINVELTEGAHFGSDHQSFEAQFIPYIYYSTGLTEKYHQVGDEANTIDYDQLARVVQLLFATAWRVVNQDSRVRSIDRSRLTLAGYVCPPCPFSCDDKIYDHPGECPVCGMALTPKYVVRNIGD